MTRSMLIFVITLSLVTISTSYAQACEVWYVSVNGNNTNPGTSASTPFRTIKHALDVAGDNDKVTVAAGTYKEQFVTTRGRAIMIEGAVGSDGLPTTIVDTKGISVSCLSAIDGEGPDTVFKNMVFTGAINGAFSSWGSSPTIINCTFINNLGDCDPGGVSSGGAVDLLNSGAVFRNCRFIDNQSSCEIGLMAMGGAIHIQGNCNATFENCVISGNSFPDGKTGFGGGIYAEPNATGAVSFKNCNISSNEANFGGGIASQGAAITVTLDNCIITNNIAETNGGGIYLDSGSNVVVTNSNVSSNSSYIGGGVWVDGNQSRATLVSCSIAQNNATLYAAGVAVSADGLFYLEGSDIEDNVSAGFGGGLYVDAGGQAFVSGGSITGNVASSSGGPLGGAWTSEGSISVDSSARICDNSIPSPCTDPACQWEGSGQITVDSSCCVQFHCSPSGTSPGCPGDAVFDSLDINGDGVINYEDVQAVQTGAGLCPHDIDGNSQTDVDDLLLFLEGYGTTCP